MKKDVHEKHAGQFKNEDDLREEIDLANEDQSLEEAEADRFSEEERREDRVKERLKGEDSINLIMGQTTFIGVDNINPDAVLPGIDKTGRQRNEGVPAEDQDFIEIIEEEEEEKELDNIFYDEEEEG